MDPKAGRKHTGKFGYHDDDCWCVMGDRYCNRGGRVWSCCGACKKSSECSAPNTHPTYWDHPLHSETIEGWRGSSPVYKANDEIRAIAPEAFQQ